MRFIGSIIILIIGFSLGGPLGLFISLIIVFLLNSNVSVKTNFARSYSDNNIKEYLENIIVLFSDISLSDERISQQEVKFVKNFLLNSFPRRIDIVQYLMERYRYFNENPSSINIHSAIDFLNGKINYNEKFSLFQVLVSLSLQSSSNKKTKSRLTYIGEQLNISDYEINSLLNYYENFFAERDSSTSYDTYGVLGLTRDATNEEIKKRYKNLVKENHPDKLHHLPLNIQKESEERMKTINEAYSKIKVERSI